MRKFVKRLDITGAVQKDFSKNTKAPHTALRSEVTTLDGDHSWVSWTADGSIVNEIGYLNALSP